MDFYSRESGEGGLFLQKHQSMDTTAWEGRRRAREENFSK